MMKNGHKVTVYDVNKSATQDLAKNGASVASSLTEISQKCQRIFTMLPTPEVILNVYKSPDGLLAKASSDTVFVDSSTVDPGTAQDVHQAAKAKNIKFFDAPVAGAVPAARAGTLVFMVGGDETEIKQYIESYLMGMGTSVFYCGPIGFGCAAKICNNQLLANNMTAFSEALHLGRNFGLDPKLLTQIINKGSGRSWCSEIYNPAPGINETSPSSNDYNGGFRVDLLYKDLGLAAKLAQQVHSPMPLGTLTQQIYRLMVNAGEYAAKDFSIVYKFLKGNK
ncbi:3-hydroxyisobutyrate dehydrogenase, mitochondrial, partial [Fragariocoptes setiger]